VATADDSKATSFMISSNSKYVPRQR
jgi:hypothetical protein